jgi:microcystin-dependent protein
MMKKSNLPQQNTINQYIADGKTAVFNYTYLILIDNDIAVYVTHSGDTANPDKDLQILNQDYTAQNAGTMTGGTITFAKNKTPPAGSIVTLVRSMQVGIETEFGNAQSFNGHTLDAAFERVLLIMQEFNTQINKNNLQYIINSYLNSNLANKLPVLTTQDNQVWVSQGGNIIAAQIENTDISTLRSELASQAPNGGDGAHLIGYYDTINKQGLTLQAYLHQFEQRIDQKIAELFESSIQTGDFILTGIHVTERKGFLLMDGREVSRTEEAELFKAIGTEFGAGDGKTTFNIPNFCRRTLVGAGGTATPILNNTVGSAGGEEVHTMTIEELVAHTHPASEGSFVVRSRSGGYAGGEYPVYFVPTTGSAGSSKPFNLMQPSLVVNGFIKT